MIGEKAEKGRAARAFDAIANALLERAVPRAREALRERFGPDADLSTIRLEGRDVHVEDTRATIAPGTLVTISRAIFRITADRRRPLFLASLEGVITAGVGVRAPVRFETQRDVPEDAWIAGTLFVDGATWPRQSGEESASLSGAIAIEVGSARWSVDSTSLRSDEATITLHATGDLDAPGAARITNAKVELVDARAGHVLDAASAIAAERFGDALALLRTAKLGGSLQFRGDTGASIDVAATSERSSLRVRGTVDLARTLDASIDGTIGLREALAATELPPRLRPRDVDVASCTLRVTGSASAPRIFGTLHAPTWHLELAEGPLRNVKLDVDLSSTALTVSGETLVSEGASEGASEGKMRVRGSTPLRPFDATARIELERVPLAFFAAALPKTLVIPAGARASGSVDVRGREATGVVTIASEKTAAVTLHVTRTEGGARVAFDEAPRDLVALCLAFLPDPPTIALPPSTQLTGELVFAGETIIGEVALETESTALLAKVRRVGSFDGTTIRGRLAARDLVATGLVDSPVRPIDGVAAIDARVVSDALHVNATSDALSLEAPSVAPLPLRQVSATLVVDPRRLVLRALRATLHGGDLSSEGLLSLLDGTMQWRLRGSGVPLETIALRGGWTSVGTLRGGLAIDATIERRARGPLYGQGELRVDHPIYEALTLLAPKATRHGVTLPPRPGTGPLGTRFSFGEVGIRFEPVDAPLDGASASGFVTLDWSSALGGRVDVRVEERLLRGSPLAIPAMLTGSLRTTVTLGGTLSDPRVDLFGGDPLNDITAPVADALDSVSQAVSSFFAPIVNPPPRARPAPAPPPGELDAILDRILDHDPASEQLISTLVDRGIDPDEFSRLLERRRRARRS